MKYTYLITDGRYHKIGTSVNPERRLIQLKTANPDCKLICQGTGTTEDELHKTFKQKRVKGEWFDLLPGEVSEVVNSITVQSETEQTLNAITNYFDKLIVNNPDDHCRVASIAMKFLERANKHPDKNIDVIKYIEGIRDEQMSDIYLNL